MSDEPPASSSPKPKIPTRVVESSSPKPKITTKVVEYSGSDVDVLGEWAADTDKVRRFCTLDIRESIACVKNEAFPHPCLHIIYIKERHIGVIFVTPNSGDYDKCRAEVGFWFDKEYLSNWIVKRVLELVIPIIFRERKDLKRLEAKVEVDVKDFQSTLEMAGFQREGVLRKYRRLEGGTVDVAMFSFLSSDRQWATDNDEVSSFSMWDIQALRDPSIARMNNEGIPPPWIQLVIIEDTIIGLAFVTHYDKWRTEIGCCLDKKYLRNGIVRALLELIIPPIFQERPDLERLEAKVEVHDRASQRTLEMAGFQREGVLRKYRILEGRTVDVAIYSVLSSDLQVGLHFSLIWDFPISHSAFF